MSVDTAALMRNAPRANVRSRPTLPLWIDCQAQRFSAWYELSHASCWRGGPDAPFAISSSICPIVVDLGFDTLYFPPIHPIGTKEPKGQEQYVDCLAGRCWQPIRHWLGCGRHMAVHPDLGR